MPQIIMKTLNIGLFGFGCVGQGLYYTLNNSTGFRAEIRKIAVRHRNKPRPFEQLPLYFEANPLLQDPELDLIVELIDDAEAAFEIVRQAMSQGRSVVTANKKMLAQNLPELLELQEKHQVSLLYEASACGSIPIIRTLEEYFDNEPIVRISGIFNGTTNYILTQTTRYGLSYEEALAQAQAKGFAESNPANDVEGYDALYKAMILALHGFGSLIPENQTFRMGITQVQAEDLRHAYEKDWRLKLQACIEETPSGGLALYVMPAFIHKDNPLFRVEDEFNGVIVQGLFSGEQFLRGRGAGSLPTGAAVLSDVSARSYGYRYEYKKRQQGRYKSVDMNHELKVYFRYQSEQDVQMLPFTDISERYLSGEFKYVVGTLRLGDLIKKADWLRSAGRFLALVPA